MSNSRRMPRGDSIDSAIDLTSITARRPQARRMHNVDTTDSAIDLVSSTARRQQARRIHNVDTVDSAIDLTGGNDGRPQARRSPSIDTTEDLEFEDVRRDSFHCNEQPPKESSALGSTSWSGRNVVADNFAQRMLRQGKVPIFLPEPSQECLATNVQCDGLRDGTSPAGDWIAYGGTLWTVMEQLENIDGKPVYLAEVRGIYTS